MSFTADHGGLAGEELRAELGTELRVGPDALRAARPDSPSPLQRFAARLTGSPVFWVLFVLAAFTLPLVRSVRRQLPQAPPVLGRLSRFSLVDQEGRIFTTESVSGRTLIAEFTTPESLARGPSPLAPLQKRVRNTADAVRLVSFVRFDGTAALGPAGLSARLASLARAAHAGTTRWTFAGGDTRTLEEVLVWSGPGEHGRSLQGKLLLVDSGGRIRRVVSPAPEEVDLLMRDLGLIANLER